MRRVVTVMLTVVFTLAVTVGAQEPIHAPIQVPVLPKGAQKYAIAQYTQEIAITNGRDRITAIPRRHLKAEWQHSGGMVGVTGVVSDKYRTLPVPPKVWVGNIGVVNSFGHVQYNRGIVRSYADGTRFDDVLSYKGKVFEHRVRIKVGGMWRSSVLYTDEDARPPTYRGLKQSCSSCHDQAGSGGYGEGLVPGGDGVLSDELDWSVIR